MTAAAPEIAVRQGTASVAPNPLRFLVPASTDGESPVSRAFSAALWTQALCAGGALALSSERPLAHAALLALASAVGLALARRKMRLTRGVERFVAVLATIFLLLDLIFLKSELAPALGSYLLALQLAKLLGPREMRDEATIVVVALVHVAIASAETVEVLLAPLLLVYAASASFALAVRELRGFPQAKAPPETRVSRRFRAVQAGLGLLVIALSGLIFYAIPRVGSNLIQIPRGSPQRMSGYSDQVALDAGGAIKESTKRAFRAVVVQRGSLPRSPLWRGRALDTYDGKKWSTSFPQERLGRTYDPRDAGTFEIDDAPEPVRPTVVDLYLEPMNTLTIFSPGVVHRLQFTTTPPPTVHKDRLGTIAMPLPQHGERAYRVTCSPDLPQVETTGPRSYVRRATHELATPDMSRDRCRELPAGEVDVPRMRAYALSVLAAAGVPPTGRALDKAKALESHISKTFRYTLDARRTPNTERVADFLFTTKEGHCEVFAGALAVLLRSVDVPARLVSGYKGGELHTWSDSYTVRDRHAHAWVEAATEQGWIPLDPTPAASGEDAAPNRVVEAFEEARDWLEVRWFRAVITYDAFDQVKALKNAREGLIPMMGHLHAWFEGQVGKLGFGRFALKVIGALLGVGLVICTALASIGPKHALRAVASYAFHFLPGKITGRAAPHPASAELEDVLRALAERGVARAPSETALDLARRAVLVLGERANPFLDAVPAYQRVRYGGEGTSEDLLHSLRAAARALRA